MRILGTGIKIPDPSIVREAVVSGPDVMPRVVWLLGRWEDLTDKIETLVSRVSNVVQDAELATGAKPGPGPGTPERAGARAVRPSTRAGGGRYGAVREFANVVGKRPTPRS